MTPSGAKPTLRGKALPTPIGMLISKRDDRDELDYLDRYDDFLEAGELDDRAWERRH